MKIEWKINSYLKLVQTYVIILKYRTFCSDYLFDLKNREYVHKIQWGMLIAYVFIPSIQLLFFYYLRSFSFVPNEFCIKVLDRDS